MTRHATVRFLLLICLSALLVSNAFVFAASGDSTGKITVLALYSSWQTDGIPDYVQNVYYDSGSSRLVVVLQPGSDGLASGLLSRISDPENIDIHVAAPAEETGQEAAAKRTRGVLALVGGYGAAILAVFVFMLARSRHRSAHPDCEGKPDWLNHLMGGK